MAKSNQLGQALGLGLLAVLGIVVLANVAQNQKASPAVRFIAQTAEGTLVQDLETGLIHLLV